MADLAYIEISPHTIRHILARHSLTSRRRKRRILYATPWAWDRETPFTLIQVDVKDIRDQEALGTAHTTHLGRHHLPRYQWTACEGRSRLRFLAYSHRLHRTNGIAFLLTVHSLEEFLSLAHRWVYLYHVLRPHYGRGMGGQPP